MTKWTFRHVLLKRAYTNDDFIRMPEKSPCQINLAPIGFAVRFTKPMNGSSVLNFAAS
jgi:hypothetical protein